MPALLAEPGMPVWLDLATPDLPAAQRLYGPLLGWDFVPTDSPGYVIAQRSGMPVAGLAQVPEGSPATWGLLLYAPDVEEAHTQALRAGATSILAPTDMGDRGWMSVLADPSGARIGLKCPADEQVFFAAGEPGTPVWYELLVSRNWQSTARFYHELTGWDIKLLSATDEFRYATGEWESSPVAGFWDTSHVEGQPSGWTVYMGVSNVDEAAAKVGALGGLVVREPWDSDFGRMATVQDSAGGVLSLAEVPEYHPDMDPVHEPDLFAPTEDS